MKDLKKNDIVLVLEPNLPRGQWPLGRITETYQGRDGHTRDAKIQCGMRTVVTPIHKLVPLQEGRSSSRGASISSNPNLFLGTGFSREKYHNSLDAEIALF